MNNLEEALCWYEYGQVPIPLLERSKTPIFRWGKWVNADPGEQLVRFWFRKPRYNIAIILGGKTNLCVIDFDNIDLYNTWLSTCSVQNDIWKYISEEGYRIKTSRGYHVYFRTDTPIETAKKLEFGADIRSHNHYVAVPPSVHPSGIVYSSSGIRDKIPTISLSDIEQVFPSYKSEAVKQLHAERKPDTIWDKEQKEALRDTKCGISILALRESISMVDFIGSMRNLIHRGRYWWSRCVDPYHPDRHPSFCVDSKTNLASCQSSSCELCNPKGFDIIDLTKIIFNKNTAEAVQYLKENYL